MRGRVSKFLEEWRVHRRALRFHGDAEGGPGAIEGWAKASAAFVMASPLEHEGQQRELSGATRSRSGLQSRGKATGARIDRSLHGQRPNSARSDGAGWSQSLRRRERALHLGGDAGGPDELADVRPDAPRSGGCDYAWEWFRRVRRGLFSDFRIQQPGKR